MKSQIRDRRPHVLPRCARCGTTSGKLTMCEDAHACEDCMDRVRQGKDETTRVAKNTLIRKQGAAPTQTGTVSAGLTEYSAEKVSADAVAHRLQLLTPLGVDCVASALELEEGIGAKDPLESMLAHQMATVHTAAMQVFDKAFFQNEPEARARLLNVAARLLDTYQRGLLAIHRLRSGGVQNIHVHHVHVADGGQAIVGAVRGVGGDAK